MSADVEEMERMIDGYLSFARGEGIEQARPTDLAVVLEEVAAGARRAGAEVRWRRRPPSCCRCAPTRCAGR